MTDAAAFALAGSVAMVCSSALVGLRLWLANREKSLEHAPVAELQARQTSLEQKFAALMMTRR